MFGKKHTSAELTYIAPGTKVTGETVFAGDALIGGRLIGTITSKCKIIIEEDGRVDGEVDCVEVFISGHFNGKLHCDKLTITNSGIFEGEVSSASIEISEGGQFIGTRLTAKTVEKKKAKFVVEPDTKAAPIEAAQ
ncbi:polymer-forming cytoskeletal protein [Parashewanella spongiae]|uniref:Polymer-forming cytoskeletal protein n=1 Tax=Parashewanella spongiae TaxID=342950 RepID=A0A3A6TQG1_9GAMM|nr:polymer-forming cytoskeletal protein [Parashewanella spongiae]MCL1078193.1 polymer-forming cytoskeletal protein [Parashewanella spongiae]RJY16388.1 polymer-forming cytoskeletal protein [Parashewanella spongiae]